MRVLEAVSSVPEIASRVKSNPKTQAIFARAIELSKGESIPIDCESEQEAVRLYNSLYLALYSRLDNLPLKARKRGLTIYIEKVR